MAPRIIRDNATLADCYDELSEGDVVVGRVRLQNGEEHVLLDLQSRGVILIPSALSQLSCRSKVFQTRLLRSYMLPDTEAVYSVHDMTRLVSLYGREKVGKVVCKLDRANAGLGIMLFSSIEDVYSQAVLGSLSFPFVVQPFVDGCSDVRAVVLGDQIEAYRRYNPDNFRHNLHCGGESTPFEMDERQIGLCREVMERAGFSYACIDLLITRSGETWVNEINLRGGLKGAGITQNEYLSAIQQIHSRMLERYCA